MENLQCQFAELKNAISSSVEAHLVLPSLILIYTTIDVCAWLDYDDPQVGVRFEKWCDTYLLPKSLIGATGSDLYGARCGVLHTLSAESEKSKRGTARQVIYGWGVADYSMLDEITAGAGVSGYVAVQLEHLRDALFQAMDDLEARAPESPNVSRKLKKWLAHQSIDETEQLHDLVKKSRKNA